MSKALRWSEQWFRRGLWLVALVFAGFLVGLGGALVGDLPRVEQRQGLDGFMDAAQTRRWRGLLPRPLLPVKVTRRSSW